MVRECFSSSVHDGYKVGVSSKETDWGCVREDVGDVVTADEGRRCFKAEVVVTLLPLLSVTGDGMGGSGLLNVLSLFTLGGRVRPDDDAGIQVQSLIQFL